MSEYFNKITKDELLVQFCYLAQRVTQLEKENTELKKDLHLEKLINEKIKSLNKEKQLEELLIKILKITEEKNCFDFVPLIKIKKIIKQELKN